MKCEKLTWMLFSRRHSSQGNQSYGHWWNNEAAFGGKLCMLSLLHLHQAVDIIIEWIVRQQTVLLLQTDKQLDLFPFKAFKDERNRLDFGWIVVQVELLQQELQIR